MNIHALTTDPGSLAANASTYNPGVLRRMFNGKKVSHILPYDPPAKNEEDAEKFLENRKRISISGVQEKLSVLLDKNELRLTNLGEQGTYILKPIPRDLKKVDQVPANEHLTMQIAAQVYGIPTAENALIFFKDGSPAYITKRFDVKLDGSKWSKEDFATLAGKSAATDGDEFKYLYSYEEMGLLIQRYVPAWRVEIEKFFSLIVFNYLFSNGDAHLKNFALLESEGGDHFLSPAYDLMNTRIHVSDGDFAFKKGLFKEGKMKLHPDKNQFLEFAALIGLQPYRAQKLLAQYLEEQKEVVNLTNRSFLDAGTKRAYLLHYNTKRNFLVKN